MSDDSYVAAKEHFADAPADQPAQDHFHEQLDLDLTWAFGAAETFAQRDGAGALLAITRGIRAIAGRRYQRFRVAEAEKNERRAEEMYEFAQFWYRLAEKIEKIDAVRSEKSSG